MFTKNEAMPNTMNRLLIILVLSLSAVSASAQYKLYADGLERYNQKDYIGAVELLSDFLTRPVRDKKFDVDAHYWRGLASFKLAEHEAAIEDLRVALTLKHANEANIWWFIAKAHFAMKQYPESIEAYDRTIELFGKDRPKKAQVLGERANARLNAGNKEAAIADLEASMILQPGNETIERQLRAIKNPAVIQVAENKPAAVETRQAETRHLGAEPAPVMREEKKAEQAPNTPAVTISTSTQMLSASPAVVEEPTPEELYKSDKRYALVIGNAAYTPKVGPLKNPVNDANAFAATLKGLDFDVTLITDATYGKIRAEMIKFREKLNTGEKDQTVGLFYYAGHGLQHDGENYIVPVDAELEFEDDIPRYCFPIQKMILTQLEYTNSRMNILILDACRNNPFPSMNRGIGENQGLGEMKKARGAFIAYATSPGSVASDGTGQNGLYTQELIRAIQRPGRTIEQVFKDVRANVLKSSGDRQNPWENSNIIGDFYFKFR
ncbi:MAG: caspase family protein [Bacteroidota bacterium]